MTIKQALIKYRKVEIDLLLAFVLKKSREFLFMHPEYQISENQKIRLIKLIKRRQKGEPVAYILGYKDFYGWRFKIDKNVLIPRPETEGLVEYAIQQIKDLRLKIKDRPIKILDVGTGSGCIIISLAKTLSPSPSPSHQGREKKAVSSPLVGRVGVPQIRQWRIKGVPRVREGGVEFYASDISKAALAVAKANAKKHKVKITFIHSDILKNVGMSFDVVVANLPYVLKQDYELGVMNLGFEPKVALTDGTNEFVIYKNFFQQVPSRIHSGSRIFLEIDPKAKADIAKWVKKYLPRSKTKSLLRGLPEAEIKFNRDLNNQWRYAEISQ
jgi:release factor glutamine methyltransferase